MFPYDTLNFIITLYFIYKLVQIIRPPKLATCNDPDEEPECEPDEEPIKVPE
jgi:hypothetical protein